MPGNTGKGYLDGLESWAVRMVAEARAGEESEWAAMTRVGALLGVTTPQTLRKWVRQGQIEDGQRAGFTTEGNAELKRLRREDAELRRANVILKVASVFFAAELDRPGQ